MFLYVKHLIAAVFFMLSLQGCLDDSVPPSDLDMEEVFNKNIESFRKLNDIMVKTDLTRVTLDYTIPEENGYVKEISEIRSLLKEVGAKNGIQMTEDKREVEIMFWSTGIVSRGISRTYIKREGGVESRSVYRQRIEKGHMECSNTLLKGGWRICTDY